MNFALESFSDEIAQAYSRLLPDYYGGPEVAKLSWKLKDHPEGGGDVVVVRDDDEIVGLNAFQPVVLEDGRGGRLEGFQSMDTIVGEKARGKGLFTRMIQHHYAHGSAQFYYGFPNANSAPGFFGKLGWERLGSAPMRFRPLRASAIARRFGLTRIDFPLPSPRPSGQQYDMLDTFGDEEQRAWYAMVERETSRWSMARTKQFLNWRFGSHPTEKYEVWSGPGGAYLVHARRRKHGADILYLLDCAGEVEVMTDMMRAAIAEAKASGAEMALGWFSPASLPATAAAKAGLFHFPERLRPIEINFGQKMLVDSGRPDNENDWLISYADSDTV